MESYVTNDEALELVKDKETQLFELETSVLYNLITLLNDDSIAIEIKELTVNNILKTGTFEPQDNPLFISEREEYERNFLPEEDQVEVAESVIHVCPKCKSKRVTDRSIQARSADEQSGMLLTCATCKYTWYIR